MHVLVLKINSRNELILNDMLNVLDSCNNLLFNSLLSDDL